MSVADALRKAADTYEKKAADYAPDPGDPFENFRYAAEFALRVGHRISPADPRYTTLTLIGVKLSRLRTVGIDGKASNEALVDTLEDLMVYLAILKEQCSGRKEA